MVGRGEKEENERDKEEEQGNEEENGRGGGVLEGRDVPEPDRRTARFFVFVSVFLLFLTGPAIQPASFTSSTST